MPPVPPPATRSCPARDHGHPRRIQFRSDSRCPRITPDHILRERIPAFRQTGKSGLATGWAWDESSLKGRAGIGTPQPLGCRPASAAPWLGFGLGVRPWGATLGWALRPWCAALRGPWGDQQTLTILPYHNTCPLPNLRNCPQMENAASPGCRTTDIAPGISLNNRAPPYIGLDIAKIAAS